MYRKYNLFTMFDIAKAFVDAVRTFWVDLYFNVGMLCSTGKRL